MARLCFLLVSVRVLKVSVFSSFKSDSPAFFCWDSEMSDSGPVYKEENY